mgnify:CR=1 FL=1
MSVSILGSLNIIYPFIFESLFFEFTLVFEPHDLKRNLPIVNENGGAYFQILD